MSKNEEFVASNPAVQAHLSILQSVVTRMATNSASSKAWCITLVSAILVLVADKGKPQFAFLAMIPTFLFFFLDAYYLALEKMFRRSYEEFVRKVHKRQVSEDDLFEVRPAGKWTSTFISSVLSPSIWPFYLTLVAMVILAMSLVLPVVAAP